MSQTNWWFLGTFHLFMLEDCQVGHAERPAKHIKQNKLNSFFLFQPGWNVYWENYFQITSTSYQPPSNTLATTQNNSANNCIAISLKKHSPEQLSNFKATSRFFLRMLLPYTAKNVQWEAMSVQRKTLKIYWDCRVWLGKHNTQSEDSTFCKHLI